MPANKTIARKTSNKKADLKKTTAKKTTAKKTTAKKATTRGTAKASGRSATLVRRSPTRAVRARRGDLIVIDSAQVGSPAREGEILRVIAGELSVSYQVRWGDGHETFITPVAGAAHIVRT
jgi:hypothetical protein